MVEELNGMYELKVIISNIENMHILEDIKELNIVRGKTPTGYQLFRIYNITKKLDLTEINARHIYYDGLNNFVEKITLSNATAYEGLKGIYDSALIKHKYKVYSDIKARKNINLTDINPVYGLLGDEGLVSIYGGKVKRDNFNINLMENVGEDKGVYIEYGKNLTGIDITIDTSKIVTKIRPIGKNNDDTPLYLTEGYVDSLNISNYPTPIYGSLYCNDIKVTKNRPINIARKLMKERAEDMIKAGIDLPKVNAKVDFILLSRTKEYKSHRFLEEIELGDTVHVRHSSLNILLEARCIKYIFDCVNERYKEIEIGNMRENFALSTSMNLVNLSNDVSQIRPATTDELMEKFKTHGHTGLDGSIKIDYKNIVNIPKN